MGGGGLAKSSHNFIVAKKLNLQLILLFLRYKWGRGLNERHMGGGADNVGIPSYGGSGSLKLLKKNRYMIFERSLIRRRGERRLWFHFQIKQSEKNKSLFKPKRNEDLSRDLLFS